MDFLATSFTFVFLVAFVSAFAFVYPIAASFASSYPFVFAFLVWFGLVVETDLMNGEVRVCIAAANDLLLKFEVFVCSTTRGNDVVIYSRSVFLAVWFSVLKQTGCSINLLESNESILSNRPRFSAKSSIGCFWVFN